MRRVTITEREAEFGFYTPPMKGGIRDSGELVTFLLEAAKAVIVGTVKDDADPDKVAQEFGALLQEHCKDHPGKPGESQRRRKAVILLFAGGLVAGACGGFFVLGMVSAARYADCKDRRNRPEEDRWKEEDQWP